MKCKHPNKHLGPTGYVAWHEWAEKKIADGWRQVRCKKCRLFVEWIKPKARQSKG